MKVLLVLAFTLAAVLAVRDPATVCFPDQMELDLYDFDRSLSGVAVTDFKKGMIAVEYSTGERLMISLNDSKEYIIENGTCVDGPTPPGILKLTASQCLPAEAVPLSNDTYMIGAVPDSVSVEAYQVVLAPGDSIRVVVTTDDPAIPVVRHILFGDVNDVSFYTNARTTISDPDVLAIPDSCIDIPSSS